MTHPADTWRARARLALTRRAFTTRALGLAVAVASLTGPAAAGPTLRDTLEFAGSTLNRLCNDADQSRFVRFDNAAQSRVCYASVVPGRLVIELRYRGASSDRRGYDRKASGILRQDVAFDSRAYFYCSSPSNDGYSTLYMNCMGALSRSSRHCAQIEMTQLSDTDGRTRDSERRSFANLMETSPKNCALMKGALNFIARRSRGAASSSPEVFFAE